MQVEFGKLSPMMQQYISAKEKYKDYILFFRVGDFYEMFFEDALIASKLLELTLTGKDCGLEERAPMCGVPHHASDIYIKRLIDLGYKVAICEQLTDPAESKGLVLRDVTKIVTPGTLTDSSMLDDSRNNYIGAVFVKGENCSVCFADISTGSAALFIKSGKEMQSELINEFSRFEPAELLFNDEFLSFKDAADFIKNKLKCSVQLLDDEAFDVNLKKESVLAQFNAESFSSLGIEEDGIGAACLCGLFGYISDTQRASVGRFTGITVYSENKFMGLDLTARRNLELTETMRNKEKRGSLLWVLDHTKTAMGKRLLKSFIEQPLINPALIMARLDAVEQLCKNSVVQSELSDALDKVYDIERLMTRVMYKTATPRDLKSLSVTALQLPKIKGILSSFSSGLLLKCANDIDTLDEISALIENAIVDEPPVSSKEGGIIKDGFNEELDSLRKIIGGGKDIISEIEQREREKTGIKNLKIGYNRVFGYYIEVTKSYYDLIPDNYIRKQTLANCERFITEELKAEENKIIGASDKVVSLESDIFNEIRDFVASQLVKVQKTASAIALADVLCSFAYVSMKNFYS
ncbi:MAG: mismatch repair protein MutS, partial [Clostridiales bacterium]|nr:mismatch repair protein MutS [Clostridiales bacterium]